MKYDKERRLRSARSVHLTWQKDSNSTSAVQVCKWMIQPFQEFQRDFRNYLGARSIALLRRAEARNT